MKLSKQIRNERWDVVRETLTSRQLAVISAFEEQQGPVTTRALADSVGIDLLSIRPRVTELLQLGLVECVGRQQGQGLYRAVPDAIARSRWAENQQKELLL